MGIKKAIIISPFFYPAIGGAETQALNIAQGLNRRGYQVIILTRRYSNQLLSEEKYGQINIIRYQNLYISILVYLLPRPERSLIIWNGFFNKNSNVTIIAQSLLIFFSRLLCKNIFFRVPSETNPITKIFLIKLMLKCSVARWITLTLEQYQNLISNGINKDLIIKPPNTIVSDKFKLRSVNKNIFNLIYCGRLINQKGLDVLVDALKLLDPKLPVKITFLLSVSIESPEESRSNLMLLNNISFPFEVKFEVNNTEDYFSKCDIGIFTSLKEGAPNVVREMMSAGLAVIASDIPGCSEIIDDDQNGFLFKSGSATDLANRLNYLLKNRSLIKELGSNARKTVLDNCSEEKIMAKILI